MKIGLMDVDGHNFPNLPLMKLSSWHKQCGDEVDWYMWLNRYDLVYKAKVFNFTDDYNYYINARMVVEGGTGYMNYDPLPDEIEHSYPDYELYNISGTAYGFLTRGCPRKCPFCIVSTKEGNYSYKVADLREFWNGQKSIKLLDPNLLAYTQHAELLQQLVDSCAMIDFTQGLDIRLINDENMRLITQCKIKMLHFAWDNPNDDLTEKFKIFKEFSKLDVRKLGVYVLTNFNTTLEQDLYRIYKLKELGYNPYVMVFNKSTAPTKIKQLQRWVNNKITFNKCAKFEDYNARKKR